MMMISVARGILAAVVILCAIYLLKLTEPSPLEPPTIDPFTVILKQRRIIDTQRHMIAVDDELLNGFMHGTWDRSCDYEVVPGELLADGSIRETVYQICPENPSEKP